MKNLTLVLSSPLLFAAIACAPTAPGPTLSDRMEALHIQDEETLALLQSARTPQDSGIPQDWHLQAPSEDSQSWLGTGSLKSKSLQMNPNKTPVLVAVLDSGVDLEHPAIAPALWTNIPEAQGQTGVDDDGNGYIDDIHGWNFLAEFDALKGDSSSMLDALNETVRTAQKTQRELLDQPDHEGLHLNLNALKKEIETARNEIQTQLQIIRKGIEQGHGDFGESPEFLKQAEASLVRALEENWNLEKTEPDFAAPGTGNSDLCPEQECRHGTHVAGIVLSQANGTLPGADAFVDSPVRILPLRVVPRSGDEPDAAVAAAIRYAIQAGASVIQMSFGKTRSSSPTLVQKALEEAAAKGVLIVHSAGNDGKNLDTPEGPRYFPNRASSATISDSWLEVGASGFHATPDDILPPFTNFGGKSVDLYAPGVQIVSTLPGGKLGRMSGTSMAAPSVSGIAALLWSRHPELHAHDLKNLLLQASRQPILSGPVALPGMSLGLVKPRERDDWKNLSVSAGTLAYPGNLEE